jgi:selenocysteine lyase/cysteine desulfurase
VQTALLDDMRAHGYGRLDREHQVYLDYTGGGLYAIGQIEEHMALLRRHVYGNPHSINPTSLAMTDLVEDARHAVLRYFNASADEYVVIFTANATGALRLIAEAYPFGDDAHLVITYDNHNSVVGIREQARARGARLTYVLLEPPAAFEDGTVNYLSLPAITIGLRHLERIGIDMIHTRVTCLMGWLIERLDAARHRTGMPVAVIHGLRDVQRRGATIAINLLDTDGCMVDERIIEQRAMQHHLSVRIGCFCNPGAGEAAFHVTRDTVKRAFDGEHDVTTYDDYARVLDLPTMGSMRVSLGVASNFLDVHRFLRFIDTFVDDRPEAMDLPPRSHC